jgi:transmembrane sensor
MEVVEAAANKRRPIRVEAADWVLRLDAAPADESLRRDFEQWLGQSDKHRAEYQKVRRTWSTLGKIPHDFPAGEAVSGTVVPFPVRKSRRVRWLAMGMALAAACVAFVLFPALQKHILADHVTGVAELREVVLPDGSVAHLDAGSAIAVDYRQDSRVVTLLSGQAFFDVVRNVDRPFRVLADEMTVTVTGTGFDVRKTADSFAVTVQSGTVEVSLPGAGEVNRLTVGQGLVYDRETRTASRKEFAPAQVASWRSRRLVVYDATFGDVAEELGRHMSGGMIVRDKSLNRQLVSGVFDLSRPHEALEGLAASQRAKTTQITPYLVIVSGP